MKTTMSFGKTVLSHNSKNITHAGFVRSATEAVPAALQNAVRSPELESWFVTEATARMSKLPKGLSFEERQNALEMKNRYPDGSMLPISLNELLNMRDLCPSVQAVCDRARHGTELLKNNSCNTALGTAARGIPGGGASSRAAKWARLNPQISARFGLTESTPRPLFRVALKTLLQHTLDFSQHIARQIGRVFPNIVMTNSENVHLLLDVVKNEWGNYTNDELENTIFSNQIVLPRLWFDDQEVIAGKLYPAGHGDYPYLMAKYNLFGLLRESGIKYLFFSNADEWLWQPSPVMVSIARELFDKGHHMVIIGTKNINNQFGGGFVRLKDGTQSLVETPRLPWAVVQKGEAPVALNTTFYVIDVDYLADNQDKLLSVEKSLVVKEVPGRQQGSVEQIFGVDSWAGDVFAAILNPAFIQWPRQNFLGIKDAGFITGAEPVAELGGRSYLHFVNETVATFPVLMQRLIAGDKTAAEFLFKTGGAYLE